MVKIKTLEGKVKEDFKINIYFNENGEELEKIIANFLANTLKDNSMSSS